MNVKASQKFINVSPSYGRQAIGSLNGINFMLKWSLFVPARKSNKVVINQERSIIADVELINGISMMNVLSQSRSDA